MKLLVHCCCAHCAAYTIDYWRQQQYDVGALWYNPNIHPYIEHEQRLSALKSLLQGLNLPLTLIEGYDIVDYFRQVVGHESERCQFCFRLRLTRTAEVAHRQGCDAFTTTLLISPQQKHELIHRVGDEVAAKTGISFLYTDLRKRYSDSRHITKGLNLYRQQYCGCIYSEWERYSGVVIE